LCVVCAAFVDVVVAVLLLLPSWSTDHILSEVCKQADKGRKEGGGEGEGEGEGERKEGREKKKKR